MNIQTLNQPHIDVETLSTKGFVTVPYPPRLRACMHGAMESWKLFCTLSEKEKQKLSGGDRNKDFGYMRRKDTGVTTDDKELFHALRENFPLLIPKAESIHDRRATHFINAVDALIHEIEPLVQEFAHSVEKRYEIPGFENDVMQSKKMWTFRYLHYLQGSRPILANQHCDRGGFTLHLGESAEGGEYFGFDGSWHPWPVSESETIIFPSMNLQHRSEGKLKALCHRVVPSENSIASGRYAMVAFIDFNHTHRIDGNKHRMQDFAPGFNYEIGLDEFQKLFVPV